MGSPALTFAGCVGGEITAGEQDRVEAEFASVAKLPSQRVCDEPREGEFACLARIRTDEFGTYAVAATPSGLGPTGLQSAYKIDATLGAGKTIAIVDAYDDPTAESDLADLPLDVRPAGLHHRERLLPQGQPERRAAPLPEADSGWAGEIALDLDMASAICPNCKILLVEANSATHDDLGAAVNTAVKLGANVVCNSYGGGECSGDTPTTARTSTTRASPSSRRRATAATAWPDDAKMATPGWLK